MQHRVLPPPLRRTLWAGILSLGARAALSSASLRGASSSAAPARTAAAAAAAPRPPSSPLPQAAAPSRLRTFRLRKVQRWVDVAPYISGVEFRFDPALEGTTGVKELWRQSRGKAVRTAFPKYTVGLETNELGQPAAVRVKYTDGRALDVAAQGLGVPDLVDALLAPTEAMREKENQVELDKN